MKKYFLFFGLLTCASVVSNAQTSEDSVKAVVNTLFTAMKNANGALLRTTFSDSAVLQTIAMTKDGKTIIRNEKVEDFVKSINNLKKESADERIEFASIKIDGNLASVWTPYKFYFNGNFSHCGANSFQLVRFGTEWKIQYLIDTRRRQGCEK